MATIIKATRWVKEGKTVVRTGSKYPLHAATNHFGGDSNYWLHADGTPAAMNSEDLGADDWEIYAQPS